jgi:hypothetical protein
MPTAHNLLTLLGVSFLLGARTTAHHRDASPNPNPKPPPRPASHLDLTGPRHATRGGTITVRVPANTESITVHIGRPSKIRYPVPPNGVVTFPVPEVPTGTFVWVVAGQARQRALILVEVVAHGPRAEQWAV